MTRVEAEKLLGGYATGTLTEAERSALFEAALDHQDLFDALADEETLRDLLADPEAKAHLLAALSSAAPPKVVAFWRRPGVIGAAASLIVAATAGLAYLRSPEAAPSRMNAKAEQAPTLQEAPKSVAPAPAEQASSPSLKKAVPVEAPKEAVAPRQMAEAPAPPTALAAAPASAAVAAGSVVGGVVASSVEQVASAPMQDARVAETREMQAKKAEAVAILSPGVVGGGLPAAPSRAAKASPAGEFRRKDVAAETGAAGATPSPAPVWSLELQADGRTRVLVTAPRGAQVLILRRGPSGVAVLTPQATENRPGGLVQWRYLIPIAEGEALDLYLPKGPVADPATLPETGPIEGFRARIHPAAK